MEERAMANNKRTHTIYRKRRQNQIIRRILIGLMTGCILYSAAVFLLENLWNQSNGHEPVSKIHFSSDSVQATNLSSDTQRDANADWKLILVNRWHEIPKGYQPELTQLQDGHAVDSRIYPELQEMFDDARAQGILPQITSSFRTTKDQQQLLDEQIEDYLRQGYSRDEAMELAEKWVALPGTSEHQIGMAVDISTADSSQQDASIVWQWLNENSYKYGFILRYPEDKTEITGVMYEQWHYRYVGKEAAEEIYRQHVCLEEYLGQVDGA